MAGISLRVIQESEAKKAHAAALQNLVRGEVRFDQHNRLLYATDASLYQVEPIGVVIPADLEDARAALRYCIENHLPILPRGGGTSLAGQCTNHAVILDFSAHCHTCLQVDRVTKHCFVEPGITIDDLNELLKATGLFFAPDPATARHANVGGCIGNNAAGTRSILYGRTAENLEGVTAMLATGEEVFLGPGSGSPHFRELSARYPIPIERWPDLDAGSGRVQTLARRVIEIVTKHEGLIRERFPKTIRRNAGYALDMALADIDHARRAGVDPIEKLNLAQLVCGSEGTLAVTTGALLRLREIPRAKGLAVLSFKALEDAIDLVVPLLTLKPSAVELLDDMVIDLARANLEYAHYVRLMPQPAPAPDGTPAPLAAVLYVEFFSTAGPEEIEDRFSALRRLLQERTGAGTGVNVAFYTDPGAMAQALKLRKAGEPLLHAMPGSRKPVGFVEDNAIPVENLATFVRGFKEIIAEQGTTAAFYAHASVGVLHVRPLLNLRDEGDLRRMEIIAVRAADLAKSLGGVMSGEHGDGKVRGPLLERFFGPELMGAFREVKRLFDPENLLNPGNIVDPGPIASIHESTRIEHEEQSIRHNNNLPAANGQTIDTFYDYAHDGGFEHAVELCNGSGVCRKKRGGSMCPSYMATLDERHSTRGRANALRLAISGQFGDTGAPDFNDPETLKTLDWCLSCKACKTECPSNVDVARYKAEYLAQSYRDSGRTPLAARVFGRVDLLNRFGSMTAPLSNWISALLPVRSVMNRTLNLAPQRSLPPFRKSLFRQLRRRRLSQPQDRHEGRPRILLFADCFTAYNEPHIGLSTVRVLEDLFGYEVIVPQNVGCCGRAMMSMGLLPRAQRTVSATAANLHRIAESNEVAAILVCEPSCLSSIKDDWLSLRTEADRTMLESLAARSFLPEQFLHDQWDNHPQRPEVSTSDSRAGKACNRLGDATDAFAGRIIFHGHCHQKSLWGDDTSVNLLRRLFGPERVTVLDAGCCGMAGSFGYGAGRYHLSMRIGGLTLFPAVRQATQADAVIAPGTSCRHQIHDGTGCDALHPMTFIDRLYG